MHIRITAKQQSYQVFQSNKFAAIDTGRQFPYVRMERQVLNFMLFEILLVPWFYRRAMHTASIRIVPTQFGITLAFYAAISFSQNDVHFVFSQFWFVGRSLFDGLKCWGKWWNRATRAACTWLWSKCLDHLQSVENHYFHIQNRVLEKSNSTHRWCARRKRFHKNHIAMFQFIVINCLRSAWSQFIFVVSFAVHSKVVSVQSECIVDGLVEFPDCGRWK